MAFGALTPAGLTQASGELATGVQQTTSHAMNLFLGLLTDPFAAGRGDTMTSPAPAPTQYAEQRNPSDAYAAIYRKAMPPALDPFARRWGTWAAGYGGSQTTDGNAVVGSNITTSRLAGVAVGLDNRLSPSTLVGFALEPCDLDHSDEEPHRVLLRPLIRRGWPLLQKAGDENEHTRTSLADR